VERLQKSFGLQQVIVTLGAKGAYVADGDTTNALPAFKISAVDTPGAGDCFMSGLAFGLYHGASLVDAASFGCLTAARSVSIQGSIPSFGTLAKIAEFAAVNRFEIPMGLRAVMDLSTASTAKD
jgi:sugar/nucleoside kinase (ribokinase family)